MYETDWTLIDFGDAQNPPRKIEFKVPVKEVPKGHCPKCKKYIGRGLHFHVRNCKVDDPRNA